MCRLFARTASFLASMLLVAWPHASNSAEAVVIFDRRCALKDVAVMVLIERHGEIGELAADELAQAWETLLDARTACSDGRVSDGLALYQSVLDLGPPRAFLPQVTVRRDGADRLRR